MFDLYPPILINDALQKKEYIYILSKSFRKLSSFPKKWNEYTDFFFEQELDRLVTNATLFYDTVNKIGLNREKMNSKHG